MNPDTLALIGLAMKYSRKTKESGRLLYKKYKDKLEERNIII